MPCLLKLQPVHVPLHPLLNEWGVSGVHLQVSTAVSHQEIKQKTHRNGVKINHQQDSILKSNPEMRAAHAWKCIHWKSFRKLNTLKRQHDTCVFQNMLFLWQAAFAFRKWTQVCPSVCESWFFVFFFTHNWTESGEPGSKSAWSLLGRLRPRLKQPGLQIWGAAHSKNTSL